MPYSTTEYLLDRANIHDTLTKIYLLTDLKQWDRLVAEVPASTGITLDYTALFGSSPSKHPPEALVQQWKPMLDRMTSTQHIITGLLIELPQPGEGVEKPMKAKVIANVRVELCKEGTEGGDKTSNGGRAEAELVRVEGQKGNPWRIEVYRALEGLWRTGNMKVLTG